MYPKGKGNGANGGIMVLATRGTVYASSRPTPPTARRPSRFSPRAARVEWSTRCGSLLRACRCDACIARSARGSDRGGAYWDASLGVTPCGCCNPVGLWHDFGHLWASVATRFAADARPGQRKLGWPSDRARLVGNCLRRRFGRDGRWPFRALLPLAIGLDLAG